MWVTAMKTLPTGIIAWLLVLRRAFRKQPALPPLRLLPVLIGAALVMQFGGNLAFQMSLGYLGLGITVPFVFACILCVGAVMGRVMLGDPITGRMVAAMAIMMAAIVLLSVATTPTTSASAEIPPADSGLIAIGIGIAAISGCSYGAVGVLIRRFVRSELSVESMFIVFSTVGAVLLMCLAVSSSGWAPIQQGTQQDWPILLIAGFANAIAFFSIAHALRFIDVNRLNVINASQNAMCAIGAVLLFHEQLSGLALLGIGLTIAGLMTVGRQQQASS